VPLAEIDQDAIWTYAEPYDAVAERRLWAEHRQVRHERVGRGLLVAPA
jgi:uncharacterized protein (DUF427 family)